MDPLWLLSRLRDHTPADEQEADYRRRLVDFVSREARFHDRHLAGGHVTGSAWIVNPAHDCALLVHHRKLNRWLQPGGHIEDDDTVLDTALREAREESGLTQLRPMGDAIFDVDIHLIPARGTESAHFHYDVRFLLMADPGDTLQVSAESHALRWFTLEEIEAMDEGPSIDRMVKKTRQRRP